MKTDYNHQAELWARDEPTTLADFVARRAVIEMCREKARGKVVLDLGCGEGYLARKIAGIAKRVIAVDSSPEMIKVALRQTTSVEYYVRDAANVDIVPDSYVDLCVGSFIAHYFGPDELPAFYSEVARVLKTEGEFIMAISHPCFQLLGHPTTATYDSEGYHYINSRGRFFHGKLPTLDGKTLEIGLCHSTIEDHFNAMEVARLAVTSVKEPPVTEELAQKYELFRGLEGNVGFMIIVGEKLQR